MDLRTKKSVRRGGGARSRPKECPRDKGDISHNFTAVCSEHEGDDPVAVQDDVESRGDRVYIARGAARRKSSRVGRQLLPSPLRETGGSDVVADSGRSAQEKGVSAPQTHQDVCPITRKGKGSTSRRDPNYVFPPPLEEGESVKVPPSPREREGGSCESAYHMDSANKDASGHVAKSQGGHTTQSVRDVFPLPSGEDSVSEPPLPRWRGKTPYKSDSDPSARARSASIFNSGSGHGVQLQVDKCQGGYATASGDNVFPLPSEEEESASVSLVPCPTPSEEMGSVPPCKKGDSAQDRWGEAGQDGNAPKTHRDVCPFPQRVGVSVISSSPKGGGDVCENDSVLRATVGRGSVDKIGSGHGAQCWGGNAPQSYKNVLAPPSEEKGGVAGFKKGDSAQDRWGRAAQDGHAPNTHQDVCLFFHKVGGSVSKSVSGHVAHSRGGNAPLSYDNVLPTQSEETGSVSGSVKGDSAQDCGGSADQNGHAPKTDQNVCLLLNEVGDRVTKGHGAQVRGGNAPHLYECLFPKKVEESVTANVNGHGAHCRGGGAPLSYVNVWPTPSREMGTVIEGGEGISAQDRRGRADQDSRAPMTHQDAKTHHYHQRGHASLLDCVWRRSARPQHGPDSYSTQCSTQLGPITPRRSRIGMTREGALVDRSLGGAVFSDVPLRAVRGP